MENTLFESISKSSADLQQRIIKIYDHLYANAPIKTPSGISAEVGKILRVCMYIESNTKNLFSEKSPAINLDRLSARRLLKSSDNYVTSFANNIRTKFQEMIDVWGIYSKPSEINLSDFDIAYTCYHLNGLIISDKERDVFGDALEIFRGQWAKKVSGQFFTDPLVTHLAISLLKFNPLTGDDLVDICSGTGGFLLAGLNQLFYLLENGGSKPFREINLVNYAVTALKGQEIDPEVYEIGNATLSSRLSIQHSPIITLGDSLQPDAFQNHPSIRYNSHLCAATNPPFGTKITIKDDSVLQSYELASGPKGVIFRSPDILFIEQNLRLLKPGQGRLAIVVPYQIISGPQTIFVREWIIKNSEIISVVDLPADTFQPHTGTKTSLLILKRREEPILNLKEIENQEIFMSTPRWIGHDRRGNPVYKRSSDGKITDEILTDIPNVSRAFNSYVNGQNPSVDHQDSFVIHVGDVLKDPQLHLNAQFYKPANKKIYPPSYNKDPKISQWKFEKLGKLVDRIFFPGRFKRNYVDYYPGAVPFLGGSNISQLIVTTDKWLSHDDPKLEDLLVKPGWILITRSGSIGIIATVPDAWNGYAMSEHIIRIIPNPKLIDPNYINLILRSQYMQYKIRKGIFGSVIDEITPDYLAELEIPIPQDKSQLSELIQLASKSEDARNLSIIGMTEAIEKINISLFNELP